MLDKADAIIERRMKKKFSYYVNPLWIKITMLLVLLLVVGMELHA